MMDRKKYNRLRLFIALTLAGVVGFLLGVLLMRLIPRPTEKLESTVDMTDRIRDEIKADNIRNNLRETTRRPHLAGTWADYQTAEDLRQLWIRQGLDSAKLVPYDVLLQYPPDGEEERNRVQILEDGKPIFETSTRLETFGEEDLEQEGIVNPFHAYSGNGDVMGDLVYVHKGRLEDYELLQKNLTKGINFTGKIVICRRALVPSHMVKNAEIMKVAAVIVYPDPIDLYPLPQKGPSYPDGPYLPSNATMIGSIYPHPGDPLTPGYPSTAGAFRIPVSSARLTNIPVHPISYGDAEILFRHMTGPSPPASWRGALNVSYQVGPGFKSGPSQNRKIRVYVNSTLERRITYNTIGFLRGSVEPDRYVIIGNHRDAWALGAVDPTGGTAVLMEISRVFGMLKQEGWRPRRSIIFASWGAEEYTLTGSVEWTEQFRAILSKRAIAYLNLDVAVAGGYAILPSHSPLLKNIVLQSLKQVPDPYPTENSKTLYDQVREKLGDPPEDVLLYVNGGTDFEAFIYGLGISVFNAYYGDHWDEQFGFYALYHTSYETFRLVDEYIDKGFLLHRAVGQLFAEMLRNLADSTVLNGAVSNYQILLRQLTQRFRDTYMDRILNNGYRNITMNYLSDALAQFDIASHNFQHTILPSVDPENPLAVRAINDQMMYVEQAFIVREDLTKNSVNRHVLFASSGLIQDIQRTFPGIMIAMDGIDSDPDQDARWEEVERQLSILTYAIRTATSALEDVTSW